ncbi:Uu.00g026880.m01.CDS01 [Anthostomella pinea]|uniref:Uu.00g026880.m01.CDS01 n=1 Tax=Anthostomella pinea TaxID=933095 RepID=A0AAI8V7M7_9PEZI|nr:Uu.00g026880.m01.CDS01 [Anthostomella pinea]
MADVSTALSSRQKAKLDEVADLMLEIYRTLGEMRILDPAGIEEGPHNLTHLLPISREHGLAPEVVYLYSHLPYIGPAAGVTDFLWGSTFADYRDADDISQGRDPFYASPEPDAGFEAEDGEYMRAWYTPLVNMGNHQSVWIYDARKHRIWSIDQEGWMSTDPALEGNNYGPDNVRNRNRFDQIPSRPAGEFLRDIVGWLRTLELVPGGGEHDGGNWDADAWRALYRSHGWPDHFDGDAFEVARARWSCGVDAHHDAEEPLRAVEKFVMWSRHGQGDIEKAKTAVMDLKDDDARWVGKIEVWKAEKKAARIQRELGKARDEADHLCPDGICQKAEDLPLWEAESCRSAAESAVPDEDGKKKEAATLQLAYEASLADAQRLRPNTTFQAATRRDPPGQDRTARDIEWNEKFIAEFEIELDELKAWGERVPTTATKAREAVRSEVEKYEEGLKSARERLERSRKWLAAHPGDSE